MEVNKSIVTNFDVANFNVKKEFKAGDSRFLDVEIFLMHLERNHNGSFFSKESVDASMHTLANTPILGYLENGDYSDHRAELEKEDGKYIFKYKGSAYGVIPESHNARYVDREDKDGVTRTYLVVDGIMWTKWDEPIDILMGKGFKSQSMELTENYTGEFKDDNLFHFEKFEFFGACLLGDRVQPAMEGSTVEVKFQNNIQDDIQFRLKQYYAHHEEDKYDWTDFDESLEISFEDDITNFPNKGDDDKISLRNSKFPQADYDYVLDIRENHRDVWSKGGNEFGNTAFTNWGKVRDGQETPSLKKWIIRRERFMERHEKDKRVAGVMAVFKWGGIVSRGQSYMKSLLNEEKKKYSEEDYVDDYEVPDNEIGKDESLEFSTSKEDADFDTPWGEVNKVDLRDGIYRASNYKTLLKRFYLILRDDYETNQTSAVYPVGIIKNNQVVLSSKGCQSAFAFLEKNSDDPQHDSAKSKLKKYYEELDLDTSNFEKERNGGMTEFNMSIEQIKEAIWDVLNPVNEDGKRKYHAWVVATFPETKEVIVNREDGADANYMKHTYEVSEDGQISLDEGQQVFAEFLTKEEYDAVKSMRDEIKSIKEEFEKSKEDLEKATQDFEAEKLAHETTKADFDAKVIEFNEMKEDYDVIKPEFEAQKLESERKEKQDIIDSFKLLSDEDKKEYVDNIDKYTKDDIKTKLSIVFAEKQEDIITMMSKQGEDKNVLIGLGNTNFNKKETENLPIYADLWDE